MRNLLWKDRVNHSADNLSTRGEMTTSKVDCYITNTNCFNFVATGNKAFLLWSIEIQSLVFSCTNDFVKHICIFLNPRCWSIRKRLIVVQSLSVVIDSQSFGTVQRIQTPAQIYNFYVQWVSYKNRAHFFPSGSELAFAFKGDNLCKIPVLQKVRQIFICFKPLLQMSVFIYEFQRKHVDCTKIQFFLLKLTHSRQLTFWQLQ